MRRPQDGFQERGATFTHVIGQLRAWTMFWSGKHFRFTDLFLPSLGWHG
jgi:hypothetical protein